jgi:hypothetical protein
MIGYGFSAKPADFDYTTFNQVDVLQRLLEYSKIEKFTFSRTITAIRSRRNCWRAEENRSEFFHRNDLFSQRRAFSRNASPDFRAENSHQSARFVFGKLITDSKFKKVWLRFSASEHSADRRGIERFRSSFQIQRRHARIAHKLIRYMPERDEISRALGRRA